ncbi:hypothetical protein J2T02_002618 [Chitinophaga terrae (ex Kim and Jung 2007)]|uniref:RagB/SusD family nutrient uptake outer membrane protein n=1 Tax=Chitinophaga terrae (ex Kim and Jung 2007) TaxID=408074 RepID=UPI002789195A|nr:RagB/SusD family nutrient uptake outer membrane protein [Chitinophaga terrae (ex Kim and Jung 2007)]MDQ0107499.1 hypothetical protein [Chitinophaga terrae (ex Kim and Jung 2007)]
MKKEYFQSNSNLSSIFNIITITTIAFISCNSFVKVDSPTTNPAASNVYNKNSTATAVLTGIYEKMSEGNTLFANGRNGISIVAGLNSDELENRSTDFLLTQYYNNNISPDNSPFWSELYKYIYTANAAIEGLTESKTVTQALKNQLLGESYFLRAFFYFYLTNLFGDIPLNTASDYKINMHASRSSKKEVYNQIVTDLLEAQNLLSEDYLTPTNVVTLERIRPNKGAATALLARVYLFMEEFDKAEEQATLVISNSKYQLQLDLSQVFLNTSLEAIWQLRPVVPQYNTFDGDVYILNSEPNYAHPVVVSQTLNDSFEPEDLRYLNWIGKFVSSSDIYKFPYKYRVGVGTSGKVTEYLVVLRLAEQYLIRAEARAQKNDIAGSQSDLNIIRTRAGLPNVKENTKETLIKAIQQERRVELFTEWGHRWLDLKRWKSSANPNQSLANEVLNNVKPNWKNSAVLFPIPRTELLNNSNISQNPGY